MSARGIFAADTGKTVLLCVCDGFSVSGMLFICIGVMTWIAGEGAFDIFGYAFQKGLHHILPGRFGEDAGNFYDYKSKKLEKKTPANQRVLLVTGIVFLVIGLILTMIWYQMD